MSDALRWRRPFAVLVAALLGAFALRLFRLDAQSIWWDEGISLHLATSTMVEIAANRAANIHPPLYFWFLKGWVSLVGATAFNGRFLSALAGTVQVAVVYRVCRHWFGPRGASTLALLFILISPLSLIYSQEIRTYAILPLAYFALLGLTQEFLRQPERRRRLLATLGLVEWVSLHLHYIVLFLVLYVNGWALLALVRQRQWRALRQWVWTQAAVVVASLPWATAVLWQWGSVQAEANAGTYLTEPTPLWHMLAQVGIFHLTGLPGSLGQPLVQVLGSVVGVLLLLLLLLRLAQRETRPLTAKLLVHWLLPLSMAVVVWRVRSFSHPRYISMYAFGLLPLLAYVLWPPLPQKKRDNGRFLAIPLATAVLALSVWALGTYFFDPILAKNDDMRGVARYLEQTATADDLILVPDTDWSLPFEYNGAAQISMAGVADPAQMWADLQVWTTARRKVFTVQYRRSPAPDWQQAVPFALEKAGTLVDEALFDGLAVQTYLLDGPLQAPVLDETNARFADIELRGVWLEAAPPANNGTAVALTWAVTAQTANRYAAQLTLHDIDGWPLASTVTTLVDAVGRPTPAWDVAVPVTTYAYLPLSPGTPPLSYTVTLAVGIQEADGSLQMVDQLSAAGTSLGPQLVLGRVDVQPADPAQRSLYVPTVSVPPLPQPLHLYPGLALVGAAVDRTVVGPGQTIYVQLHWLAEQADLPALQPRLWLQQGEQELVVAAHAPALGRYATTRWQAGEAVVEHRALLVPPQVAGAAEVMIGVGDTAVSLGSITIEETTQVFTLPPVMYTLNVNFGGVARLVGYDLPDRPFRADEVVPLTLYWESLATGGEVAYTVFTHILDANGRLIGQHDMPPVNGQRPTTGWVQGEYIEDRHELTFRESYAGEAVIEVGLYDPDTGIRLLTDTGQDFFYLPVTLMIEN
ncbi:MAG: glycosyltransferase family 39 protein [Ardenticatenaceae bacterium]|nr:glycosyltransferase family 39 protein [Ardenticatenaceae bacterium]